MESCGPGYHPKLAPAALVLTVLLTLVAVFAMLSTTTTADSMGDFPGFHRTTHLLQGHGGSGVRDALKKAL